MRTFLVIFLIASLASSCGAPAPRVPEVLRGGLDESETRQSDAYLHFMNGTLLEEQGALDDALAEYKMASQLDPRFADIAHALAALSLPVLIFGAGAVDAVSSGLSAASHLSLLGALLLLALVFTPWVTAQALRIRWSKNWQ